VQYKVIFLSVAALLFLSACPDSPTNPQDDNPYKQESIDWPSLADSPWPMWGHDPQWTFRSQYIGPNTNDTFRVYQNLTGAMWESGFLIDENDNIYITTSWDSSFVNTFNKSVGVITRLNADYQIVWRKAVAYESVSEINGFINVVPVISKEGVCVFGSDCSLTRIKDDGIIESRTIINQNCPMWALQIDKEGNLYWANNGISSYTVNGEIRWENTTREFTFIGPFAPQGDRIYASSRDSTFALDAASGNILWSRPGKGSISVDCNGKIYTLTDSSVLAIMPDGNLDWETKLLVNGIQYFSGSTNITVGPEGNLYFDVWNNSSAIISVSPEGDIRWLYQVEDNVDAWIIADAAGNTYTYSTDGRIFSLDSNGELRWSTQVFSSIGEEIFMAINSRGELLIAGVRNDEFNGIIKIG